MANKAQGLLITLEGIDGSGKSSLGVALRDVLVSHGYKVLLTKEPGGTSLGVYLRSLVQGHSFDICPEAEFLLFAADRANHFQYLIEPALLQADTIVISDRMADSSLAYQGFGRGLDKELIRQVNRWVMKGRVPDLTLYLRIDYQTALKRLQKRSEQLTAFEEEKASFFQRVITGFETLCQEQLTMVALDATQPIEHVQKQAVERVLSYIKNRESDALAQAKTESEVELP
jgi:dTMP kinase